VEEDEEISDGARLAALGPERRIDALVVACEPALVAWTTYVLRARPAYVDSVVGLRHVVDPDLPARALDEVRARHDEPDVRATVLAWVEPVVALQDQDLVLPERYEYAFYAIYNLHRLVFEPNPEITPALVLSQAISARTGTSDDTAVRAELEGFWASWEAAPRR